MSGTLCTKELHRISKTGGITSESLTMEEQSITHVNDASFWLFKEYFNLSIRETFKTWGLLLLTTSVVGLSVVLVLSLFI